MRYIPVNSTFIKSIGHDPITNTLSVVFNNRVAYFYRDVPEEVFDRFLVAESTGRFFNQKIRDKYDSFELEGIELFHKGMDESIDFLLDAFSCLLSFSKFPKPPDPAKIFVDGKIVLEYGCVKKRTKNAKNNAKNNTKNNTKKKKK